jgi:cellulose synthase/poly-beta-1,6-N-acetylglucosamine synthase-like glycosyltransferase
MALWCRDCKQANVHLDETPKRVTIVLPFYENHGFIQHQIAQWQTWPQNVRDHVEVIVVDDGSPVPLLLPEVRGIRVRQFRINVDVRWNWLAARNIGAHHAAGEWVLMTDMDHMVPSDTLYAAIYARLDPVVVYAFEREEHTGDVINPHSASFLMTKAMFWEIGGYDETLSGHYGTDGEYRRRLARHAQIKILPFALIRHEYVGDSSTTRYKRKQPQDAGVKELVAARSKGWRPRTLSFPYQEIHVEVPCHAHH